MVDCGMLVLFLRSSGVTVATNYTVPQRMQILPRTERRLRARPPFFTNLREAGRDRLPSSRKANKISKLAACGSHHGDHLIIVVQVALGTHP
jgi:hypothetical protein